MALLPTPFVSNDLLREIQCWKNTGATNDDILDRLRLRCVPTGYSPKPWSQGMLRYAYSYLYLTIIYTQFLAERTTETYDDKLKSVLAQLDFSHQVLDYDSRGIRFRTHIYIPEIHPVSCSEYHEREDDAHVLKVRYILI